MRDFSYRQYSLKKLLKNVKEDKTEAAGIQRVTLLKVKIIHVQKTTTHNLFVRRLSSVL